MANNFFFVEYNAKFIASYKTVKACLNFINKKGLQDDCDNTLRIFDKNGEMYNPVTGEVVTFNY